MSLEIPNEGLELRLDQLKVNPDNNTRQPGENDPDVRDLADSIRDHGQIHPILVNPTEDGNFEVIVGFRRVAAIALLNKHSRTDRLVRATVVDAGGKKGRLDAFKVNIHENLERKTYTPLDLLHTINKLIADFGYTKQQAAKELRRSAPWVSSMVKLNALTDRQKHQLHTGTLTVEAALELLKLSDEQRVAAEEEARKATKAAKAAGRTRRTTSEVSAASVRKAAKKAARSAPAPVQAPTPRSGRSAPRAARRVPSMKEFREFMETNLGPTVNIPVQHFLLYLIAVSSGKASEYDITKAADDVLMLAVNPGNKTEWIPEPGAGSGGQGKKKASKKAAKAAKVARGKGGK